ncbi:DUF748 domain-containing protein [Nitrosospira sp. NpAV]|uniref:DUF748 domain-containing protein n=1 Tax=Nitrosospira sp. NpAV TaxID=58133 RepID=UPI00059F001C|nr:DUF748 domain-containing protein [Nitrosospira sp. NpAV]KIO48816.1 hypothetical protein SQ11_09850 [Nitrosospira sp. NpAV]
MTSFFRRFASGKRLRTGLGILAAIVILFGLLGYLWLPGYAKTKLETLLSEAVQRPVTVQSIDIQPYTLELTVRGFRVGEKAEGVDADKALLSVDELYTNLSIVSIARRAPVISALSVKGPAVRIVREGEQRFNITDLIEDFMKRPDEGGKSMFSVSNIIIEGGRFEFIDRLKNSHQEISEIRVGIPFVANFESDEKAWVEPHFSARINGAPLVLDGKVRPFTKNREATLELKLNDIDLTRIDEYSPIPVGISLLSGRFDSDLLLTFSQVDGEPPSMVLAGNAALRKFEIENQAVEAPYAAKFDRLDVKLTEINLNGQKPSLAGLVLADAAMIRKSDSEAVLNLPKLSVEDATIDSAQQSVMVGTVTFDGFKASMRRETDGRLDLAKLFAPAPGKAIPVATPVEVEAPGKPWAARLGTLKLVASALRFEDSTLTKVAPMVVDPLDLTVDDIDLTGAKPLKLALKASVNQKGSLETNGSLAWAPLAIDLAVDAKDIDLVALQGWAGDRLKALLTRGAASFQGKVKMDGSPLKVALNGDTRFTNFNVLDKVTATDLMRWRSLDINGIEFVNEPMRVNINSVAIADFFAYVILSSEGKLNLKDVVGQDDKSGPPVKTVSAAPSTADQNTPSSTLPAPAPAAKPTPVHIGRIMMQGGNIIFNDQFIKPNYRANLTGLAGRVGPLDPKKPGEIDIRGTVDKTAPLKIAGKIDTLGSELYLDIAATAKGIDMPTFSPYSGKYVGYAIEKGKLSVDIHYHVEKGELRAENNVFLDQLTLGEKVESPDALSIPINLALALLKNRHGEIDVHLPISGSINDPQFSIGGLIVKVILNLLTKAATAPFALLGSILGDGEEMSAIDYSSGLAQITPEAEKRLQTLSKALTDRPALKLEITGRTDPEHDPEALKRTILERKIKAQKLSENVKKGETSGPLEEIELKPEEYAKYLTLAYKEEKFAKPKNVVGLTKSLPVPEMEQLMLANINAGDNEMRDLAERRAVAARDWLIEQGGVPGDRVFLLEPKVGAEAGGKKSGSRVEFSLR